MTETSEHGFKGGHSEGERTRGNGAQTTNAERQAFSDNNEHHRFETSIADLETKSGFGFLQHAVPISRGVRYAVVDVEVSFLYRVEVLPDNYPDVRTVVSDTLAFLQNYPEKKVYWEIYARKAASKLFKDYGVFSSLTVTLVIHPDDLRAYLRTATATVRAASSSISASPGPGTGLPVSTILCAGAAQANLPDVRIGAGGEPPGAITYFVEIVQGQASPATWCLCQRGVLLATLVKDCPPKLSPIWPGASASCSAGH